MSHTQWRVPSLANITLDDIHYGFSKGYFNSEDLVTAYLARIAESNERFRAVIETNPDALAIAQGLDAEYRTGDLRGYASLQQISTSIPI